MSSRHYFGCRSTSGLSLLGITPRWQNEQLFAINAPPSGCPIPQRHIHLPRAVFHAVVSAPNLHRCSCPTTQSFGSRTAQFSNLPLPLVVASAAVSCVVHPSISVFVPSTDSSAPACLASAAPLGRLEPLNRATVPIHNVLCAF